MKLHVGVAQYQKLSSTDDYFGFYSLNIWNCLTTDNLPSTGQKYLIYTGLDFDPLYISDIPNTIPLLSLNMLGYLFTSAQKSSSWRQCQIGISL